jgi:GxxExxY protein
METWRHGDTEANMLVEEELTEQIIGAFIEVHRELGPGLLESAYEKCVRHELELRGFTVRTEVPLPVVYKGIQLECGYRIDLVVNDTVIVEIKTVDKLVPVHEAQLLTYLKLSGIRIGLLVNFHSSVIRNSIKRMVL